MTRDKELFSKVVVTILKATTKSYSSEKRYATLVLLALLRDSIMDPDVAHRIAKDLEELPFQLAEYVGNQAQLVKLSVRVLEDLRNRK